MATVETTKPIVPPLITAPITLTRNGVEVQAVNAYKEKGKMNGQPFVHIDPATDIQTIVSFLGEKNVSAILLGEVRKQCQVFTTAATKAVKNAQGVFEDIFNIEQFKKFVTNWESSQESTRSLQAKLQELSVKFIECDMSTPAGMEEVLSIKTQMQEITQTLQARKAQAEAEAEDETTPAKA